MATWSEAVRRLYADLVKRRARVRVTAAVEPAMAEPPIFVIGLYRSGTTLVRYVLDSHSRVACPPESGFLTDLHRMVEDPRSRAGLESLGYDRDHVVGRVRAFASYFFEGYAASRGKPRWADKTPSYVEHIEFLAEVFPGCRMIALLRHPLDQIHSATRGGHSEPAGLTELRAGEEDIRVAGARYWATRTARMLDYCAAHPDDCVTVRYEDLCRDPGGTLEPMFEFLGERWEPEVLEFYRFEHDRGLEDGRVGATRSFALSTRHWISWPPDVVAQCEEIVGPVSVRAGYGPHPGRL